jgi:hypothetical protein
MGAMLLDLEEPTKVLAVLDEPLIRVSPGDRDGYVPNVVWSCGSPAHGELLVVPSATWASSSRPRASRSCWRRWGGRDRVTGASTPYGIAPICEIHTVCEPG